MVLFKETQMELNIIFPVLNEELRLKTGIENTVFYLQNSLPEVTCELTIVDNGSTDKTAEIANALCACYSNVKYLSIKERGVGAAFRAGVNLNTRDIVGYMDIDLSTDLHHLSEVINIFLDNSNVEIVNATRYSKDSTLLGRKWYRNFISYVLIFLLKLVFHMEASDAICGFKFFKKAAAEQLIEESSQETGWFFIIELLLRAEKNGYHIKELPVKWTFEAHTKVKILKVTKNYLRQIWRLAWEFHKD
ncbi:glycosyltransferase [Hungatella hathewayi]|nr:glycosyltransferase [Hungatella hathewayi]RGY94309.1 glycosyltransferase [Hungatella hathewayi]